MGKKKLFRFHKGGLDESMKTCVKVKNLRDIEQRVKMYYDGYGDNIQYVEIASRSDDDSERLGDDWEDTYYVIGHTEDTKFVAGMCNFYEDKTCRSSVWRKYMWHAIFVLYLTLAIYIFLIFAICGAIDYIGKRIYEKYFGPIFERIIYNLWIWDE